VGGLKRLALAGAAALAVLAVLFTGLPGGGAPPVPSLALGGGPASQACSITGHAASDGAAVAKAALAAGFRGDNLVTAVAIAHAESGWNANITNLNTNGSTDYGLWQINSVHAALLAHGDWHDPAFNASVAFQIWTDAHGFSPWVTFWSGSYRQFIGAAQEAVDGLGLDCNAVADGALSDPGSGPQGGDGLRPRAENIKALTLKDWGCATNPPPCISSIGGYAYRTIAGTGTLSDHATGNAVDIMLGSDYRSADKHDLGQEIADYWAANLAQVGGHYVIFNKRIFTSETGQWRPYAHPSGGHSDTLDHVNHVHVSVKH
jgi:hypothetical protein